MNFFIARRRNSRPHNQRRIDVTSSATHQVDWLYPPAALQQILYNAVLHRTYEGTNSPVRIHWFDDRVEILSPGEPYGNVTPENFGKPGITDYRNPNLGEVMKNFGYVQAFGRGINLSKAELKKNGNPDMEFSVSPSAVHCILWSKPCKAPF